MLIFIFLVIVFGIGKILATADANKPIPKGKSKNGKKDYYR